jgi:hypothetical protein
MQKMRMGNASHGMPALNYPTSPFRTIWCLRDDEQFITDSRHIGSGVPEKLVGGVLAKTTGELLP